MSKAYHVILIVIFPSLSPDANLSDCAVFAEPVLAGHAVEVVRARQIGDVATASLSPSSAAEPVYLIVKSKSNFQVPNTVL